jgi:hypothetical protein
MVGAADAGVSLSKIAEAVGASQRGVVSRVISRTKARGTLKTANRRREKYKTTARDEHHLVVLARKYIRAINTSCGPFYFVQNLQANFASILPQKLAKS